MNDCNELLKHAKPCPFCGSKNISILGKDGIFWVSCSNCGAEGSFGLYSTPDKALEAWNKRADENDSSYQECVHLLKQVIDCLNSTKENK